MIKYKAIIISDVHLGTENSKAAEFLEFLNTHHTDILIINGDFVDGWALSRGVRWKSKHTKVISKVLDEIQPQIIINCAAYTSVDKAESETELADILNHQAVAVLAQWSHSNGCQFLHISTDYVFDGNSSAPLNEETATGPINVYGQTKLAGELACLRENPMAIIIRTSWVYSSFGTNFVKTMSRLMQERDSLNVVSNLCRRFGGSYSNDYYTSELASRDLSLFQ